jgi:hypothetical protein
MNKLLVLSALLLAGCAGPQVVAANPESITLTYSSAGALEETIGTGMAHCTKLGRNGVPMAGYRVQAMFVQVVECR